VSPTIYGYLQTGWRYLPEGYRSSLAGAPLLKSGIRWMRGAYGPHDELYDAAYYARADRHALRSAPAIAASIVEDLSPRRVIDVGCGTGALLAALQSRGVTAHGIEYSQAALDCCGRRGLTVRQLDLEQPGAPDLGGLYDVAVSMEVAEHLPARAADRLVDLLCAADRAVVFTAARPGQGGSDHVNEQPQEYWIEKFHRRGHRHDVVRSLRWQRDWKAAGVTWWYSQNLMVFIKASA
jgi:SAM-dependent methyltransferase